MSAQLDVVSIGSAVVDVILKSSQFSPHNLDGELMLCEVYGGKADVEEAILTSGGAGTNTAVGFARQGFRAGLVAEVGQDILAQIIVDEIEKELVDTRYLIEEDGEKTGVSAVLVAADGSRSALTFRGAAKMLDPSDIPFKSLETIPWLHLSSIGNPELVRQLFLFCREHKIQLSWNPSKTEVIEIAKNTIGDFSHCCRAIFLNEIEFAAIAGRENFLKELSQILVVTRGKNGGEVYSNGNKIAFSGKEVPVVCELGAGDAFASGFIGALMKNHPVETAIEWGLQNGSSVVQHMSAKKGLLTFL